MEAAQQQAGRVEELPSDRPIEGELANGERHVYRVSLNAGQFIRVLIEPPEALVDVSMMAADGRLASISDHELRPESVASVAGVTGEFRIAVTLASGVRAPGRYRLRITELRQSEPLDDHRARAERAVAEGLHTYQQHTATSAKSALERLEEGVQQWQAARDRLEEARTLLSLARIHNESRDPRAALGVARAALAIFQEVGERRGEAAALNEIGSCLYSLEEFEDAAHHLELAMMIYRDIGPSPRMAETLNNLGAVRGYLSDPQTAIDSYSESLQLYRELGNRQKEAGVLNGLGATYMELGQPQKALDFLLPSLAARREVGDRGGEAYTLHHLGVLDYGLGRIPEALEWLNQALALWRLLGPRNGEAATMVFLAKAQHASGHRRQALASANIAMTLFRSIAHRTGEVAALLLMARLSNEVGDRAAAQRHAAAALDLSRSIGARRGQAFARMELGEAATAAGEWDRAAEDFRAALEIQRRILDADGEVVATLGMARLERARGRLDVARSYAEATLALIESQRMRLSSTELRAALLAARHEAYEFATDLLMQLHAVEPAGGHDAEAFETSERAKARSLLDQLVESGADIRQGVDPDLVAEERRLQQRLSAVDARGRRLDGSGKEVRIAEADREIERLTVELRELRGRIRTRSPRYAALTEPRPVSVATLQREILDDDTVLLEYSLGKDRSFLWAVTKRTITSYVLPAKADIEAAARHAYALLTVSHQRQRRREAERAVDALAHALLGPAKDSLAAKRIAIVADGALQFVPFAVLRLDQQTLIQRGEVVHLPSASTLAVLRREFSGRPPAPKSVAVFADPVLSAGDPRVKPMRRTPAGSGPVSVAGSKLQPAGQRGPVSDMVRSSRDFGVNRFDRLVFTRREAETIRTLAGRTNTLVALDFEANRLRVIDGDLAEYRTLHFATHGLLNGVHPNLSGLVLSLVDPQGHAQDGFLRNHDIYNLRLGADLVVLSACRTALGEEIRGEGLVSLVRGFMYAGTPRVIASLWDVRDEATSELMRRFYASMIRDGLAPAAALRAAQVWMSQHPRWHAPYYWAGFVFQGEWR
jgi:CHAT domain-containing protein